MRLAGFVVDKWQVTPRSGDATKTKVIKVILRQVPSIAKTMCHDVSQGDHGE